MPSCFCLKKPQKSKKITIDELINYACYISKPMVVADILGYCNDFIEYKGWYFKYRSEFTADHKVELKIQIKRSIDDLTNEVENNEDCVVCTENTCESIICCNQPVCKKCLKDIYKCNPDNFTCPMCRKDLNNYTNEYRFSKEEVKTKAGGHALTP